jgi:PAT family beta-lactamase induction signal transducer AmpG
VPAEAVLASLVPRTVRRVETLDRRGRAALHARLTLLYVASGFPFAVVTKTVPVFLKRAGEGLGTVGAVPGFAQLAWTLKFLWAPLVDRARRRRHWLVPAQVAIALLLGSLALGLSDAGLGVLATVAVLVALASATQDLAVDAWTVESVPPRERGPANAVRVAAYRGGLALAGGALLWVKEAAGWSAAWGTAAGLFLLFAATSLRLPERTRAPVGTFPLLPALRSFSARAGWVGVASFVLLFKLGDYALSPMTSPFQVDAGLSDGEIGTLETLGIVSTLAGAVVGGVVTKRIGLFAALWILGLLQAGSNLVYGVAAATGSRDAIWTAGIVEPFCGGLGTAPFLSFLMTCCEPRFAATQFAILTALMGLGRTGASAVSGVAANAVGYAPYFFATAALALPAYALLPWVRPWSEADETSRGTAASATGTAEPPARSPRPGRDPGDGPVPPAPVE